MNLNIAFHTIIYIMVFLFPGLLFRKAFFSDESKKFLDTGSSLSNILWNILVSICLVSAFTYTYIALKLNLIKSLDAKILMNTLSELFENKTLSILSDRKKLNDSILLILIIYLFSLLLGYLLNRVIFYLRLDNLPFFKFKNNWYYLTKSNKTNNLNHKRGSLYSTKIDIKTKKNELFTGKLNTILFDKEGKVECITVHEAYKFYHLSKETDSNKINTVNELIQADELNYIAHSSTATHFTYQKRIQGDIFSIPNTEIENICITYIEVSNLIQSLQKAFKTVISFILLITTLFCITLIFVDYSFLSFKSFAQKFTFSVITIFSSQTLILLFVSVFKLNTLKSDPKLYLNELINPFLIFILTAIPYLYVFDILSLPILLTILSIYFITIANFISSSAELKKNE